MADRTIAVPGQGGGPASYTLSPGEAFTLRSATWRQSVAPPLVAAVPEIIAYSPEGLLIGRISGPALIDATSHGWEFVALPFPGMTANGWIRRVSQANIATGGNGGFPPRGFVWDIDANVATALTPLAGYTDTIGADVNDLGVVCGLSGRIRNDIAGGPYQITATVWPTPATPVATGPAYPDPGVPVGGLQQFGTWAQGINNAGQTCGALDTPTGPGTDDTNPWGPGGVIAAIGTGQFGFFVDQEPAAVAINDAGNIAGVRINPVGSVNEPWFYNGVVATAIPLAGGVAFDLNETDGVSLIEPGADRVAVWDPVNGITFDSVGFPGAVKAGLNGVGDVCWRSNVSGGLAVNASQLPGGTGLGLPGPFTASAMNDAGVIVGKLGATFGAYVSF